jgi:phosphopentomutase
MRGFIIVLDSFGVGEAPDAKSFGDEGASTIKTISKSKYFEVPNMQKMGLLAIDGVGLDNSASHNASYGSFLSAKTPPQATGKWQELYLKSRL